MQRSKQKSRRALLPEETLKSEKCKKGNVLNLHHIIYTIVSHSGSQPGVCAPLGGHQRSQGHDYACSEDVRLPKSYFCTFNL